MASPFDTLNRLSEVFVSTEARIAVTIAAILTVVGVWRLLRRYDDDLAEYTGTLAVELIETGWYFVGVILVAAVTVGVWGQAGLLGSAVSRGAVDSKTVPRIAVTVTVVAAAQLSSRLVKRFLTRVQESSRTISKHQREVVYRVSQVVLWMIAVVIVLGVWNFNLSGILIGAGFAGIVLGMAARQTLGAMIAGFVLMFDRPFEIGDWVEIGDAEGIVRDITIVNTRIETFDGEYVILPNDQVTSVQVTNRTRKGRLRLEVEVGVDYDSDVERAAAVAVDAVTGLDEILRVPKPQSVAKEFGGSAVVLGLRFWIDNPSARRKWRARTAVIEAVHEAFDEEGVKIPFPQRELAGREEAGGLRIAGSDGVAVGGGDESSGEGDGDAPSGKGDGDATDGDAGEADGETADAGPAATDGGDE